VAFVAAAFLIAAALSSAAFLIAAAFSAAAFLTSLALNALQFFLVAKYELSQIELLQAESDAPFKQSFFYFVYLAQPLSSSWSKQMSIVHLASSFVHSVTSAGGTHWSSDGFSLQ
jgi:hypothetical protein